MKRFFKWLGIALATVIFVAIAGVAWVLTASKPTMKGELDIAALSAPVKITFDDLARPYVEARTMRDAFVAEGFLHGNNRLFQMELFRRAGQGQLSDFLGKGMLKDDEMLWRFGVPQLAAKLKENASDEMRGHVAAYVAGVNAAIQGYAMYPVEFLLIGKDPRPWTEDDVFAIGALMAFQTANNQKNEMLRLALMEKLDADAFEIFIPRDGVDADYPYVLAQLQDRITDHAMLDAIDIFDHVDTQDAALMPSLKFGSNGWVVAPEKSATGNALFAFDSHDDLGLPNLFYEVNLFFDGGKSIRGWSVAGLPGVINGYNESIAWGLTNIGDTQDLFLETRSQDDPSMFLSDGEWYRARTETVSIPMGRKPAHEMTITYTKNGPLISEEPPISLAWTAHNIGDGGLDALIAMNRAQTWSEFNHAVDDLAVPTTNATYADTSGTIGFRTVGLLPLRGAGQGLYPLDGSDSTNAWQGFVDPVMNPVRSNPPEGFLAAANARVSPDGAPVLVSADNAAPYRIARIRDVLSAKNKLSVADMAALQMDWHDTQAEWVLPGLLAALNDADLTPTETAARTLVANWANAPVNTPDSAAALIYQTWYLEVARAVFEAKLGSDLYTRMTKRNYFVNHALDRMLIDDAGSAWWDGDRNGKIVTAFKATVAKLRADHGDDTSKWRYGAAHKLGMKHELGKEVPQLGFYFNIKGIEWGGSTATVGRARWRYDRSFDVTAAATVRVTGDMPATGPNLQSVIPGGQAGHQFSKHYRDQFEIYAAGGLTPALTAPDQVSGKVLTLRPGK